MDTNLRGDDPRRWGHSLANLAELLIAVLDAAEARSVSSTPRHRRSWSSSVSEWTSWS